MKVRDINDRQVIEINGVRIWADEFAWDGCHKLYIVTSQEGRDTLEGYGYDFLPIDELEKSWEYSCSLKFISSADLGCTFVSQFAENPVTFSI